jgi:hypothetical protein
MNAYNPLDTTRRLEAAGLERRQAEAIADEIAGGTSELVTKEQLDAALDKQTIRLGGFIAGIIALASAILGTLISVK